jgi:hypothetical protein
VRFDGIHNGVTRFVLSLPLAPIPMFANGTGYHTDDVIPVGSKRA